MISYYIAFDDSMSKEERSNFAQFLDDRGCSFQYDFQVFQEVAYGMIPLPDVKGILRGVRIFWNGNAESFQKFASGFPKGCHPKQISW